MQTAGRFWWTVTGTCEPFDAVRDLLAWAVAGREVALRVVSKGATTVLEGDGVRVEEWAGDGPHGNPRDGYGVAMTCELRGTGAREGSTVSVSGMADGPPISERTVRADGVDPDQVSAVLAAAGFRVTRQR